METVVRYIRPLVWGCEVIGFMQRPNQKNPVDITTELVRGKKINHVGRVGKYIVFSLDDGYLVSHLRMTGQWFFTDKEKPAPNAEKHFRWGLTVRDLSGEFSGYLWFNDPRKFGTLEWVSSLYNYEVFGRLGPDGLLLNDPKVIYQVFLAAQKSRRPIKNFLLDQKVIAGVGNIYASEALFEAKINPLEAANKLTQSQVERLCRATYRIFKLAIDLGGASISDYTGGRYHELLRVYGRVGEDCYECNRQIEKTTQAGRSTFFCPKCQGVEENELF